MYRVELKVLSSTTNLTSSSLVPNVPCGVESLKVKLNLCGVNLFVPNVPCGVERWFLFFRFRFFFLWFLMYRVELKDSTPEPSRVHSLHVPNVPCGVESKNLVRDLSLTQKRFLMYRVELKEPSNSLGFALFPVSS